MALKIAHKTGTELEDKMVEMEWKLTERWREVELAETTVK